MTDGDIADKVYIEPLTVRVLEEIIRREKPDSLLPNMGGQAGIHPVYRPGAAPPGIRSYAQTPRRPLYSPPPGVPFSERGGHGSYPGKL